MTKVLVALLNQGEVSIGYETALYQWMTSMKGYDFELFFASSRPIPSTRHKVLNKFLSGDYEYLVMLDDDNPPHQNILELLDLKLPVVGGVYPGRTDRGIHFHVYKMVEENGKTVFNQYGLKDRNGLQKVDAVGTGLIVIRRDVLEKVKKKYKYPFEEIFNDDGTLLHSDDLGFCIKCKKLGIDIYAHWDYYGSHYKIVDLMWIADLVAYASATGKTNFPDE